MGFGRRSRARRPAAGAIYRFGRAGACAKTCRRTDNTGGNAVRQRHIRAAMIALAALLMGLATASGLHAQAQPDIRVTLLGVGTPTPLVDRFGPSTLVEAGTEKLVFDCGRGCPIRLWQKGVRLGEVKLFVTHLHSDHVNGIVDLWLTGWLPTPWGRRTAPFVVFGPEGTKSMAAHLEEAFMPDIRIRMADEKLPREGARIDARDILPGVVYEQ